MNDTGTHAARNPRRQFLGSMGLLGAGAVLGACTPVLAQPPTNTKPDNDLAILNFALNLEYLEAAFYAAAVGRLDEVRALGGGAEIILPEGFDGNTGIAFESQEIREYAQELAEDEINHVKFLRTALMANAVARPVLDLGPAFAAAGNAASGGAITNFNPFANDLFFLHGAFIFEDVGVTAYKGAAPLITSGAYLEPAAGILAVEAYHAGMIRTLLHQQRDVVAAAGLTVQQIVQAISNLRDSVDGTSVNSKGDTVSDTDQGVVKVPSDSDPSFLPTGANIALADVNSIAYSRTPAAVLAIVYLGSAGTPGGFYPNGLNGDFSALV